MNDLHLPGILSDRQIEHLCEYEPPMIDPFSPEQVREENGQKIISWGCSSFGYDIRAAPEWKVFTNVHHPLVDPKKLDTSSFVELYGSRLTIPPNSFALTRSKERFAIPGDVTGVVLGKSTYARVGIVVNCTPLEAGWHGYLTIEISNTTPLPALVYANEGICQVIFFRGAVGCRTNYADRAGKYQNQGPEIVLPKL